MLLLFLLLSRAIAVVFAAVSDIIKKSIIAAFFAAVNDHFASNTICDDICFNSWSGVLLLLLLLLLIMNRMAIRGTQKDAKP